MAKRLSGGPTRTKPEPVIIVQDAVTTETPSEQLRTEVDKVQGRYEKKIRQLEKQNRELHQTTVEQFAKAVEAVEQKFIKTTASSICGDMQSQVMQCYHDNPRETLNCSRIIREYSTCVQQQREKILKTESEKQMTAA